MQAHYFRLTRGTDLREALLAYARTHDLHAVTVLSGVGSLSRWQIRCADGHTICAGEEPMEIVSLQGTLSLYGLHVHISLAREDLSVIGGHLLPGCIINTTAEIVLLSLSGAVFLREMDAHTGYKELVIKDEG